MKRGITVLLSLCALMVVAYFTASKWAIRHETRTFLDAARDNRPVQVDIAVRRDKEMQANAGLIVLPVAVLSHGNTVKFTEYSFLSNLFAARGYMAVGEYKKAAEYAQKAVAQAPDPVNKKNLEAMAQTLAAGKPYDN